MDERQLKPSLLRDRVLAFLQELKEAKNKQHKTAELLFTAVLELQVAPTSHQLWHVRGVGCLVRCGVCLAA